jgi:THO complex subunit 2
MSWHADPAVFEAECSQHPGFLTVFRNAPASSSSSSASNINNNKQEQLDYENFRHVVHKWHYKLTKCFIICLKSEEYLQMRNSLIILTKIAPHYPKLNGFCAALEKQVEKIKQVEKDKRQDIFTLASAYLGQLKIRKIYMVDESKFHLKENTPGNTSTNSSLSTTPTPATSKSASQTKAAEAAFRQPSKPSVTSSAPTTNGVSSRPSSTTTSQNGTSSQSGSVTPNAAKDTNGVSKSR